MPERYTLLHYGYVPDMLERRGPHRDAHLELIRSWKDEGRIVLAGAVGDPPHGALIVLRDAADGPAFVDADPYARNGLVTNWRVEPWTVVV
ncbi:MAG: hypothetical protein E6G10_18725 [Actinobacteria bacterium]|nr:MAG: hypothetical protein E6G10_18725 [Actinomycetota bacterium]